MSSVSRLRSRGFTMMELMLTILLIGVLFGLATPVYQNYRERVRVNQAARDIAALGADVQRFALDNRAYPETLDQIGAAGRLDPWGRPYRYYNVESNGRGGARKDKRLNPLNTDFDLYSLGKNGVTKPQISQKDSVDDIIRASNGRFVGKAEDY
ncbi:MAG: prepilin-type N-terminal cleavage/methylation domain-containing protein [Piscinibacter sp.]|uniref:prepilin-type N-terminal cleavage/methylation domain-containing protein n=1 Tax=Piscinibacter sp. TaxID=1903157 RepID=UPI003D0C1FDD